MKINEIITESDIAASPKKLANDQVAALKGAVSLPSISMNKSNGSAYEQYRFMIATGLVDGKGTGEKMPKAGAMAGDPLLTCYTDEEFGMIKDAADMMGSGPINQLSNTKSMEADDVHKVSPHQPRGPIALRPKKTK
jgi:hypothetical protein